MTAAEQLAQGVAQLGLALPQPAQRQLLDYLALIRKWNKVYNLTAVREMPAMVSRHLLDCLAVVPYVSAATVLDAGSGAGLPGIPLALALPRSRVTLLDSSEKKAAFLRQAVIELRLPNAEVVCERAEKWQRPPGFGLVITRAFSDLAEYVARVGHLVAKRGELAAMKGGFPAAELAQLPASFRLKRVVPLAVPGLRAARHLVLLEPV